MTRRHPVTSQMSATGARITLLTPRVDPGYRYGHLVAEVGVDLPLDRPLDNPLHHRRRGGDAHLLGAIPFPADPAGVEDEGLELGSRGQDLEQPIPLP